MLLPVPPDAAASLAPSRFRARGVAMFVLAALVTIAASCGPNKVEVARNRLDSSLAVLADSGDVEALRTVWPEHTYLHKLLSYE